MDAPVMIQPGPLSPSRLLDVWEQGAAQSPVRRALTMLAAACPEARGDELARLSIGQRDATLLAARERTFGARLDGLVSCPRCGECLELAIDLAEMRASLAREALASQAETLRVMANGYAITFRVPTSADLLAIDDHAHERDHHQSSPEAMCLALLARCVLSAECGGAPIAPDALPPDAIGLVTDRMSEADPQADVRVPMSCAACGYAWHASFDVLSFFWSEIEAWAARLLRDVHALASAYGWREADILALSAARRHAYLELIGA